MPDIGKLIKPASTLDYQTTVFDAIEYLVINDVDHAVIKKDEQVVGIVCLHKMLGNYSTALVDISKATVLDFMEPAFFVNHQEHKVKTAQLMIENGIEHIAVNNHAGKLLGVVSAREMSERQSLS